MAQRTIRPIEGPAPEPLELWAEVCRAAASDSGACADRVLDAAGSLDVMYCQSWPYDDPAGRLAALLGIAPKRRRYSGIGGTTPQVLVSAATQAIAGGELDVAVVVGGEALATLRAAKKAGARLEWSYRDPERKPFPFEAPFHPAEVAHQVFQAYLTFAIFDMARRGHLGVEPDDYRRALGELLSPLSAVAKANPHAWFPTARSPGELIEVTPANRMVAYPYTKYMVAVMDVDMAAAVVLASDEAASRLGVPRERRVYLRGAGEALDPLYVAEHDPLWASPAMAAASSQALSAAGAGIDEVAHLDLYSCFGSSLNFACDALGIDPADGRGLTVTGGLPFAGGPGSCYMLHSIASMTDVLRSDPGSLGLVSGVGMHMTKHVFALYSTTPPHDAGVLVGLPPAGSVLAGPAPQGLRIRDTWEGSAKVAAYSVLHGRSGEAEWGVAVCDLPSGERAYARFEDPGLLADAEEREWVGSAVELSASSGGVNILRK